MADNLVSQPPLTTPMIDPKGMPSRAWAIWFRDLYQRTAYQGGNAIDSTLEYAESVNQLAENTSSTLSQTVKDLDSLILATEELDNKIIANSQSIEDGQQALIDHEELDETHDSNGKIVGFNDLAEVLKYGLVKQMESITKANQAVILITEPDASSAPSSYSESQIQGIVDLVNANKQATNEFVTKFNQAVIVLNNLIDECKNSDQMNS